MKRVTLGLVLILILALILTGCEPAKRSEDTDLDFSSIFAEQIGTLDSTQKEIIEVGEIKLILVDFGDWKYILEERVLRSGYSYLNPHDIFVALKYVSDLYSIEEIITLNWCDGDVGALLIKVKSSSPSKTGLFE